jgi:hypothetical protein
MTAGFANNVNPRGLALFVVQLVFLVLAVFFFALRCYVKLFMLKKVTADDWLMALAMVRATPHFCLIGRDEGPG